MTKRELVAYYAAIAHVAIAHLRGRPLMLGRWPYGMDGRGFGQFECRSRPEWMSTFPLRLRDGRVVEVCVANDAPSLVWLANQGVVELHPYLARDDAFDQPIAVVFDLDPGPPADVRQAARLALLLRDMLSALGVRAFAKLSGAAGIHLFVPLNAPVTYAETKAFARTLAVRAARDQPDLAIAAMSRASRAGKVFVDWAQNDERKQTIAPYSLRAMRRPAVSAPISWPEVDALAASGGPARGIGPAEMLERVNSVGDLFADVATLRQQLPAIDQPRPASRR